MSKVCRMMKNNPKNKKNQKQPLCWMICNHGNKIVHYKENGIQIALHCSDHCPWKYWTVSARFHNNIYNNSHSFPKYMRGLSRKMYILTNQVAYLCEMVWNTEMQCSGHIAVWTPGELFTRMCAPQSKGNIFFKKLLTNHGWWWWIFIIIKQV